LAIDIDDSEHYFGSMSTNSSMAMAQDLQSKNLNPNSKSSMEVNSLVFTKNKKISNSKLKRLSLRRSKSSQSDQIGSTSLTSVKTEGNLNHSFSPVIGSGLSNPFLQNLNKKIKPGGRI